MLVWLGCALLVSAAPSAAGDASGLPRMWANAGLGAGDYAITDQGPVMMMGASWTGRYGWAAVTGRYTYVFDQPAFGRSAQDFGILAGPVFRLGGAVVHPAAGVAGITGSTYQLSGGDSNFGPDAGTALALTVFPANHPRLALHALANLNSTSDLFGAMLVFQLAR